MSKCNVIMIIAGCCLAIALAFAMCKVDKQHMRQQHAATIETIISTQADSIDIIDTTEIIMDKRNFVCIGDIDLSISDVGVVSFMCATEEKKVIITANPQDIFITQYIKREKL